MIKYFTAVGKVTVTEYNNQYHQQNQDQCNFSHVVQATSKDQAHEKVLDYYIEKSSPFRNFDIDEIEIFDFIC